MTTVNLEEAIVSHEGQNVPAIQLIGKLQTQLQEAASRLAAVASTLGDIHAALLNANMVEVKLTLSKEDYDRFQSLGGADDSERIRKAVMSMIHPEESVFSQIPVEARKAAAPDMAGPFALPGECRAEFAQAAGFAARPEPLPRVAEQIFPGQPAAAEPPAGLPSTTRCPRCQSLIELPETSEDQWSVEIRCGSCGVKYLVKSGPSDFA